ncbi:MAG TPA: SsrA-binding protein SmpB [Vulgatibacter sp.]|nr:SsrA-binding protein SmpB [Vulgatibacter sp.]
MSRADGKGGVKLVAENRRARHDYVLGDKWEAGLSLLGSEVKSLREGNANLSDSYAAPKGDELFVHNLRIGEYKAAAGMGHAPLRERKLLLHRAELDRILRKVKERGYTLVPTRLYFKDGRAKLEIALGSGKTKGDRREAIKERETRREVERALRGGRGSRPRDE